MPSGPGIERPSGPGVERNRVEHDIGTEFLGYRIDTEVGTGGKGVVCLGEQTSRASNEDV